MRTFPRFARDASARRFSVRCKFFFRDNSTSSAMDINKICKALASPLRRDILAWLKAPSAHFGEQYMPFSNGVSAGQIHERCGVSKSTVSTHLAILHNAGLVTSLRVGQWVFFKRNEDVVNAFLNELTQRL
jgi:DNA-binding transcriptional ArsR family regulator